MQILTDVPRIPTTLKFKIALLDGFRNDKARSRAWRAFEFINRWLWGTETRCGGRIQYTPSAVVACIVRLLLLHAAAVRHEVIRSRFRFEEPVIGRDRPGRNFHDIDEKCEPKGKFDWLRRSKPIGLSTRPGRLLRLATRTGLAPKPTLPVRSGNGEVG